VSSKPAASSTLRDIAGFLRFVLKRWSEDRCPQIAGNLTYITLLAIFPMFGVVVAVLSQSPVFEDVMSAIKIWLLMNFLPEIAGRIITVYMEELAQHAARLTWFGLGVVLALAVWTMHLMDRSFNAIWRVSRARSYWALLVGYVALLVTGPLLLLASVTFSTYVVALSEKSPGWAGRGIFPVLVPVAMSMVAFFLLYRIVPHRRVPWRHALLGAGAAALFFEGAKHVLANMVRHSPTYSIAYGAFAAFPAFLVWLYVTWLGVLLGAELTACAAYWHGGLWKQAATPAVRFREALAVTQALIEAGAASLSFKRLLEETRLPPKELEETLAQMVDGSVVVETADDSYTLTAATREVLATRPKPAPRPVRKGRRGKGRSAASSR
jgi:membrane protein